MPRIDNLLLFPSVTGNGLVSGFSKWKGRLDEQSGITDWRLHDLRRTTATGIAKLGVPPDVIERILNHTSGSLGGVVGIHNRFGYLPEMRQALERWAEHLETVLRNDTRTQRPRHAATVRGIPGRKRDSRLITLLFSNQVS